MAGALHERTHILSAVILIVVVLVAALLDRWSVPALVALGTGILFGSDVLGLLDFSNVGSPTNGHLALVFILFHGGFSTRRGFSICSPGGGGLHGAWY